MDAQTLHCPGCGAAASSDATKCEHCGARLATVACPSCFGLVFLGAKFCQHCGAGVTRVGDTAGSIEKPCPQCHAGLESVKLANVDARECPKCEGLWIDVETFNGICADREQQAAILGGPTPPPEPIELTLDPVRYLPCPECHTLMNRVNFAQRSGVIIDTCRGHGTWFDRDELRHIVEFIRAGGLEKAREVEIQRLERARRENKKTSGAAVSAFSEGRASDWSDWDLADALVMIAAALARLLIK
jgi:Zn-finger nucleic acid-binding protein